MSIQALPAHTANLLRCSMNLTSPCDLVKELVDNSIDAKATAIDVSVSSNTIDRISVRDNGTGIDIDDFNCLGRRAHTSKLRAFEELARIGGTSLGFRGEALASVNALADVIIITKKARDPVAWRVELVHGVGGVRAKQPVSATVGTTVAATKLFESMPPRRKYLLKEKNKTISKIQDTLRAYALARPHIKWSLKVVGNSKPMWSYSPASGASGREAILQLFGASLLEKCTEISERKSSASLSGTGARRSSMSGDWVFSGYIGVQHSTSAYRQVVFISIDGRPMSSSWQISKEIANSLKSRLCKARKQGDTSSSFTGHLFVQLNIQCPPMSYDANIAARKDEVLFSDEKCLLKTLEVIFHKSLGQRLQTPPLTALLTGSECETIVKPRHEDPGKLQSPGEATKRREKDDVSTQVNKNKIGTGHHNVVSHGEQDCLERSATKQPTVRTVLKTSFTVNMSKREDDESDDGNDPSDVQVEIPRRASPVQADDHVRKDNIRRYFHPVPKQDFDIACDDTATTAETPEAKNKRGRADSHSPGRMPLQSLTASDLNRIRDEAESSPEQPGSNSTTPHLVRPARNVDSGMESPPSQRVDDVTRHRSGTGGLGRRVQQPSAPPLIGHSPIVLTPPPSDPRHRIDANSPSRRPRLRLLDTSPTPSDTANRFNDRCTALATAASSSRQGGQSWNRNSGHTGYRDGFVVPWARDDGGRPAPGGMRGQGVTQVAGKPSHTFASRTNTTLFSRPAENDSVPSQSLPLTDSFGESPSMMEKWSPRDIEGVPLGYSHASQIDLARTPAPMHRFDAAATRCNTTESEEAELIRSTNDHGQMVDAEWAAELAKTHRVFSPFSPQKHGRSYSDLSERLLFRSEGVASTLHLCTAIDIGHGDIERLASQNAKVDRYELSGDIAVTLLTANLSGVQSVQRRLQWCVDAWMQKNQIRSQVDYTM
ncbi:hypothetical protein E4U41_000691 [Claviceps citrina]|nr:hypothetical protein E4U41_000691 [Claviceps citrina]